MNNLGTLYVVATPIGNLEDITLRALRVLKEVDTILCEDTRITKKLLLSYKISTPTLSFHANTNDKRFNKIFEMLEQGKDLALVTDAGTPTISDPGTKLASILYEKFGKDAKVIAIPGASALTAALSISGISSSEFIFLGFLPRKKGRNTLFKELASTKRTVVFYESPHRILKTLDVLSELLDKKRQIFIAREMTKLYEEGVRGTISEMIQYLTKNPEKVRGEFVVVVRGARR